MAAGLGLSDAMAEVKQHVSCAHTHQYVVIDKQYAQVFRLGLLR